MFTGWELSGGELKVGMWGRRENWGFSTVSPGKTVATTDSERRASYQQGVWDIRHDGHPDPQRSELAKEMRKHVRIYFPECVKRWFQGEFRTKETEVANPNQTSQPRFRSICAT